MTCQEREISQRVHINSVDKKVSSGIYWANFLNNPDNKKNQIIMFLFPNRCGQKFIEIPLIIKSDENTCDVTKETFDILSISIHEEVRTKLIFRVRMSNEAV